MASAALALIAANSPFEPAYHALLEARIGPSLPRAGPMTPHLWVADGLMAIFFLLIGLEVKREWYEGRLSTPAARRLPTGGSSCSIIRCISATDASRSFALFSGVVPVSSS